MKANPSSNGSAIRTVCHTMSCGVGCGLLAHVKDGVLTKVEPADMPNPKHRHICARGLASMKLVYHPDRLKYPMKRVGERGEGKWERISWDEALDTIAARLKEISDRYGSRSLLWATAGMGGLDMTYTSFAGLCKGTMASLVGFGDAAGPCADMANFGTFWGEGHLADFEDPGMCVIWGSNIAETQPPTMLQVRNAREKGTRVVAIDPRFTASASKADVYIPIRPGTDSALALGMIHIILDEGLHDRRFITDHTVGPYLVNSQTGRFLKEKDVVPDGSDQRYMVWDRKTGTPCPHDSSEIDPALTGIYTVAGFECRPAFQLLADLAQTYSPTKVSEITEVPADTIRNLALDYARRKPVATYRGMGMQRTFHGDLTFRAINALAAVTGNLQPGSPRLYCYEMIGGQPGISGCNFVPILKLYDVIANGDPYPIKALWIAKHNFVNQLPDSGRIIRELLPKIDFIVVAELFMNPSAQYADIVLPACTFYEQSDLFPPTIGIPGGSKYFQLQNKVIEPLHECKPDPEILRELARRMNLGDHFEKTQEQFIESMLASGYPSEVGITMEMLKENPVAAPANYTNAPDFATPSGKMTFYSEKLVEMGQQLPCYMEPLEGKLNPLSKKYPLVFLNTHTRYRTHSIFANLPWLSYLDPEPVLEIHPNDAEPRGVREGDVVHAFNDRGKAKLKAKVHEGIKPGTVNVTQGWWPEHFLEGSHQTLTHAMINSAQEILYEPNSALYDVLVDVEKVREG